jgi:hypothetical protein
MKKLISKTLNTYTINTLPANFWNNWKENKDEMKKQGYSPFKAFGGWWLAIYDGGKATQEEYNKQEAEKLEKFKNALLGEMQGYDEWDYGTWDKEIEQIEKASSIEEVKGIFADLCNNADYVTQIEEEIFKKSVTR